MSPPNSPPRWVRQFNEEEEVAAAFQRRRALHATLCALPERVRALIGEETVSEEQDWREAEREVGRVVEVHGDRADERR